MKLQRQESRKLEGKKYDKWVVTIPPQVIKRMEWEEGEELAMQTMKSGVLLFSASIKKGDKSNNYKITLPKKEKYTSKEKFLKIYNNLPLSERKEVVVVLNGEGITWQGARNYILHETDIGKEILKKLESLKIV